MLLIAVSYTSPRYDSIEDGSNFGNVLISCIKIYIKYSTLNHMVKQNKRSYLSKATQSLLFLSSLVLLHQHRLLLLYFLLF